MADLTTESSVDYFKKDLDKLYTKFRDLAHEYAARHQSVYKAGAATLYNSRPDDVPSFNELILGFSMVHAQLTRLVSQMEEVESVLWDYDDGAEDDDYHHALGEMFALKSMYLASVAGIVPLENARLMATDLKLGTQTFFRKVCESSGGVPTKAQLEGSTLHSASVQTGVLDAKLLSYKGVGFNLSTLSAPASTAIPTVPMLLP